MALSLRTRRAKHREWLRRLPPAGRRRYPLLPHFPVAPFGRPRFRLFNAITHVQDAALGSGGSGTTTLQTQAFGSNPTVGNYIVAWAWGWDNAHTVTGPGFTDTGSNSYTVLTNAFQTVTTDVWCGIGFAKVATSGASFKVTCTPTVSSGSYSNNICVCAAEFSGVAAASPGDGSAGSAPGTTAQSFAPGSLSFTANDLLSAVFVNDDSSSSANITSPSGWTSVGIQHDGNCFQVGQAVYNIAPASPVNPTWTTVDTAVEWAAAQMALLAAGGAAAGVGPRNMIVEMDRLLWDLRAAEDL